MSNSEQVTPEQQHLEELVRKCHDETDPARQFDHLQALKTFLLAHIIQQSTIMHQVKTGQVVEGDLEDRLIEECSHCLGETQRVMKELHTFLRTFEEDQSVNSMEFRVAVQRLLSRLDKGLSRFRDLFARLPKQVAMA
ncbi:MAG: hypothetical protein HQL56_08775 [Magnetococcales bacterium]|nr:hypothetical protein [Magnetococcales bacterium]MBF0309607.1 hypothetical protein [Magnetococcales bacterium]